jgi:hypothetical protein
MKRYCVLILILFIFLGSIKSQNLKRIGVCYYVMNQNNKDTIYSILVIDGKITDTVRIYLKIKSNKYSYIKDSNQYEIGRFCIKSSKNNQFEIPNHYIMDKIGIWKEKHLEYEYLNYFGLLFNYSTKLN